MVGHGVKLQRPLGFVIVGLNTLEDFVLWGLCPQVIHLLTCPPGTINQGFPVSCCWVLQVAFNCNHPGHCKRIAKKPLRYVLVVTGDPNAALLDEGQRQAVRQLLDNSSDAHKAVIGATLVQAQRFLAAIILELTAA
jgi:hypothetical protein